jgi:ATP-dependent RNA helicase DeaD
MNILFKDLPIIDQTKQAIEALGLVETTDIQHYGIPVMLEQQDMIGQAQTGTGKTFAFAIPIIERIDVTQKQVQALVICPTRELAVQVYKEFIKLVKFNPEVKITSIYGGESYQKQFKSLAANPHIIVATPGRAIDHLNRQTVDFKNLKVLVLDEADEMLKMGFQEDLETLLRDTPRERQTALFSATIPPFLQKVASKYQKNPKIIKIETATLTVTKTKQYYYYIKKTDRDQLTIRLLDYYMPHSAIIFANTKVDVDNLTAFLQKNGYEADALHGDLKQSQRDHVMQKFRANRLKILIATDVAARGLDIPNVDLIVNYELPFENEIYVHRIGRTGRAGKSGMSISIVYPSMRTKLSLIERFIKTQMVELEIPSVEKLYEKQIETAYQAIKKQIETNTENFDHIIKRFDEDGISQEQVISALLKSQLNLKQSYDVIEAPQQKKPKVQKENIKRTQERTQRTSGPRTDRQYYNATINLGKQDGLKPVSLLDYFKKYADLYPQNIGNILMGETKTEFQILPVAVKRIDSLQNKMYQGRKIKLNISK